jgi:polyisoprenyl-teichoic acid--peptidoglycan teichoic acid transferase
MKNLTDTQVIPVNVESPQHDDGVNLTQAVTDAHVTRETERALIGSTALAGFAPLDMSLPGEEVLSGLHGLLNTRRKQLIKTIAVRSAAVLLVAGVIISGMLFANSYIKLHKAFRGNSNMAAAFKPSVNPNWLKGQATGRVNILLLGRDGNSKVNPDITNTMMLVSIDTVNNTATLISVPGDIWVHVPGAGVMKIDAAWQNGEYKYLGKKVPNSSDPNAAEAGFTLVDQSVSQVLGVNIDYNAILNFQGLVQAVNAVGGIPINVQSALIDQTMAWQNNGNATLANAGTQTMNGAQALLYVMSKESSSDFARAQRQRQVLSALISKVVSLDTLGNPIKINDLVNTLGNNLVTDMSLNDAGKLYPLVKDSNANVTSLDLNTPPNQLVTTGNMDGESIVLPSAGLFNYSAIKQFVALQLKNPYVIKEDAKVLILNGTDVAGLATNMANLLKSQGINVIGEANTPKDGWRNSSITNMTKDSPNTADALNKYLHIKVTNNLPDKSIPTDGADFVIIIGNDEANISQNQTN